MSSRIYRGARVIDPARKIDRIMDIAVSDGIFVDPGTVKDASVVDLTGYVLAPGFIDLHVHLRQPGKTDAEMTALVKEGKFADLDLEELLHIAAVNPEVAQAALEQATKEYKDARAFNNLAVVYAEEGQFLKALDALNAAVKAGDNSAEVNNNLALVYLAQGDVVKAEEYAKGANAEVKALVAASKGEYAAASKNLTGYNAAIAQVQDGNLAAAKKSLAGDNSAKADYLRAVIAAKEGNLAEAKSQLNSAVAKDSALAEKAKNAVNLAALK